jgi:hypothetical protein
LLTSKPVKRGKPITQFSAAELNQAYAEAGLADTAPLAQVAQFLKARKRLKHVELDFDDSGFKSLVKSTLGKSWGEQLTLSELTTLRNALLSTHEYKGKYVIRQTGGMPPLTEWHIKLLGRLRKVKPQGPLEGSFWWAKRVDTQAPGFADFAFWPLQKGFHRATQAFMTERARVRAKVKELELSSKDLENIGRHAIWQQPEGKAYLQTALNVTEMPELSPAQAKFYEFLRHEVYEPIFAEINAARAKAGLTPIQYVENYFTFFRDLQYAADNGLNILKSSAKQLTTHLSKARQTYFQNVKKRRAFSDLPIAENALSVIEKYLSSAYRHVHVTPELAILRKFAETTFARSTEVAKHGEAVWPVELEGIDRASLRVLNPRLYESLHEYINYVAGMPVKGNFRIVNKVASALNKNLAFSILAWNLGSTLRQFGALRHSWHQAGTVNLIKGIGAAFHEFVEAKPGTRFRAGKFKRGARAKSEVLLTRTFDVTAQHILETLEGKRATASFLGYLQEKLGKAGLAPLMLTDGVAAVVGWHAAHAKAKALGLKGAEAIRYADEAFLKTQGSSTRVVTPPALRQPWTRTLLLFQTYVLNEWTYLTREVLGFRSDKPTLAKVKSVLFYLSITMAMNEMFTALGIRSPFPDPLSAIAESQQRGEATAASAIRVAKELAEPIPIVGGAVRYGSGLGGPALQLTNEVIASLRGDRSLDGLVLDMAKAAGIPGTQGFWNAYRVIAQRTDQLFKPRKARKSRPSRKPRISR